jgi:hypothetical protein
VDHTKCVVAASEVLNEGVVADHVRRRPCVSRHDKSDGIESATEPHNPKVRGSNPAPLH